MPSGQTNIEPASSFQNTTGNIDYMETNSLQATGLPTRFTAQALEYGMNIMGDNGKPPPIGIGVKVIARKNTTG